MKKLFALLIVLSFVPAMAQTTILVQPQPLYVAANEFQLRGSQVFNFPAPSVTATPTGPLYAGLNILGGQPPYRCTPALSNPAWFVLNSDCSGKVSAPLGAAVYSISFTVTDAAGKTVTAKANSQMVKVSA